MSVFCCSSITPYRPRRLDHQQKFDAFMHWANLQLVPSEGSWLVSKAPYAVQLVRQINYGPQESIRYFVPTNNGSDFMEAAEDDLLSSNFKKMNSYKDFKCAKHNKFFEVNLYQKDPTDVHHWRANPARPARDIDLSYRQKRPVSESSTVVEPKGKDKVLDSMVPLPTDDEATTSECTSLSDSLKKIREKRVEKNLSAAQHARPDMTTLGNMLRFLLPRVETSLGSSPLLSLLSLDWVNEELGLGLDLESLWDAELTVSNITTLFCDCLKSSISDDEVDLTDIEDVIIPAMYQVEPLRGQVSGRTRLQKIVGRVFGCCRRVKWVSKYGGDITSVLESGPGEELLEHVQRRDDELRKDHSNRDTSGVSVPEAHRQVDKVFGDRRVQVTRTRADPWLQGEEEIVSWMDAEHYELSEVDEHGFGEDERYFEDYAACDKECGYCGHCPY